MHFIEISLSLIETCFTLTPMYVSVNLCQVLGVRGRFHFFHSLMLAGVVIQGLAQWSVVSFSSALIAEVKKLLTFKT